MKMTRCNLTFYMLNILFIVFWRSMYSFIYMRIYNILCTYHVLLVPSLCSISGLVTVGLCPVCLWCNRTAVIHQSITNTLHAQESSINHSLCHHNLLLRSAKNEVCYTQMLCTWFSLAYKHQVIASQHTKEPHYWKIASLCVMFSWAVKFIEKTQ